MSRAQKEYIGVAVAIAVILGLAYGVSELKYHLAQKPCVVTGFKLFFGVRDFRGCQ